MLALLYISYQNPAHIDEEFISGVRCEQPTTDHPICGTFHPVDWRKFLTETFFGTNFCTNSPNILLIFGVWYCEPVINKWPSKDVYRLGLNVLRLSSFQRFILFEVKFHFSQLCLCRGTTGHTSRKITGHVLYLHNSTSNEHTMVIMFHHYQCINFTPDWSCL
jgi:hypothetical protein